MAITINWQRVNQDRDLHYKLSYIFNDSRSKHGYVRQRIIVDELKVNWMNIAYDKPAK